jgi:hypothetical protein
MTRDKTSVDITAGDITSVGHNVRRDKISVGTKHPAYKMSVVTKRQEGLNIRRTKHPFGLFSINST